MPQPSPAVQASPSAERPRPGAAAARRAGLLVALIVALLLLSLLRLCVGSASLGWPSGEQAGAILNARMLRLVVGVLVGVALAVSGVSLQTLLRNPLAEPFLLGLSSGAGVGVMTQLLLSTYYLHRNLGPNQIGATIGAGLTMFIVYMVGRRRGVIDPVGLILVGVVISTLNGAAIMVIQYLVPAGLMADLARWMMGYIDEGMSGLTIKTVAAVTLGGAAVTIAAGRAMDVATFSDAEAVSMGVNLGRLRTTLFAVATLLAAGAVVLAGPIAFVGLISPHLARLLLGPSHRALILGSALIGGMLVIAADMASSLLALKLGIGLMPIGVFTAILGGPAFLWMLRPQLGRGME